MAKKNEVATTPAKAKTAPKSELERIHDEIRALVDQYNESVEFAEFRKMRKISEEIAELVTKYNTEAERTCFAILKASDNPMLEAAKMVRFDAIAVREKTENKKTELYVADDATIRIDPQRLYDSAGEFNTKVGHDPQWRYKIPHLSAMFIVAVCKKFKQKPKDVWACLNVDDATRKLGDVTGSESKKILMEAVQDTIDAMIGPGYTAPTLSVDFLEHGHTRYNGNGGISTLKPKGNTVRFMCLDLCRHAFYGTEPDIDFDVKKGKKGKK